MPKQNAPLLMTLAIGIALFPIVVTTFPPLAPIILVAGPIILVLRIRRRRRNEALALEHHRSTWGY